MSPTQLFQAGKLEEAIQALSAEIRDNPADNKRRTFLFELLCFSGDLDRARKHLELLAKESQKTGMGALLYEACMHSERTRRDVFEKKEYPHAPEGTPRKGVLTTAEGEKPFESLADADPRIGARLEVFSAGAYYWIPLEHVESFEMQAPKRLRDLLWSPILVKTGPGFKQAELGECLLPVLCPFSFKHADDNVKLGRMTLWEEEEDGVEVPYGQKMFLADNEEIPVLDIRKVEFAEVAEASESAAG